MTCPEENAIVDFVRGALPSDARAALERHIDGCPACAGVIAELVHLERPAEAADPGPGDPLPTEIPTATPTEAQPLAQGDRVGRYVVQERVGRGGMGVVYAALDPELDRKVAIKLLLGSPGGSLPKELVEQRARLLREAQALARLTHPNVITVHDVGEHDGRIFMAMEFVEGTTLRSFRTTRRSWREVLAVFMAAGRGLAAAHAAGLVHRDFKPDNVLLGSDGRVLVTDFGLARPAAGRTDAFTSVHTQERRPVLGTHLTETGALVGTPAYMAPEQLAGERSDALADQFSFSVALYEMLYGERPFAGDTLGELMANVSAGRIRPVPRDASVPRHVRRAVLRGLAPAPRHRHPDMAALLAALERDPRHTLRTWASLVVPTAVLAIGIVASRREAEQSRHDCDRVETQLVDVWDRPRRERIAAAFTTTGTAFADDAWRATERHLDEYAGRWIALQRESCEAEAGGKKPASVLALQLACLDRGRDQLSALTDVFLTADPEIVAGSVDATRALPIPDHCMDTETLARAGSNRSAELETLLVRARAHLHTGRIELAESLARTASERAQVLHDAWTEAEARVVLADLADLRGNQGEAEAHYHEALTTAITSSNMQALARVAIGLLWTSGEVSRAPEAVDRWRRHGEAALARLGPDPELEAQLAHAAGTAHLGHGRLEDAERELTRALGIRERAFGPDHPSTSADLSSLARLDAMRGDLDRAREKFERVLALAQQEYGPHHPSVARALDNLGACLAQAGRYAPAIEIQLRALTIREVALGSEDPVNAASHHNIANTLAELGRLDEAATHAERALALTRRAYGEQHIEVATELALLGNLEAERGQLEPSLEHLRAAVGIARASGSDDNPRVARYEAQLAHALVDAGEATEALPFAEAALAHREAALGPDHPDVGHSAVTMARVRLALGQRVEARIHAERALELFSHRESNPEDGGVARMILADALGRKERARARALVLEALQRFVAAGDAGRSRASAAREWLRTHE